MRALFAVFIGVFCVSMAGIQAQVTVRSVALTGQAVPGGYGSFQGFTVFSIDGQGRVTLYGLASALSGNDAAAVDGIWSEASGGLSIIVKHDDAAPGTGGTYSTFRGIPTRVSDGRVVFQADSSGGAKGIWAADTLSATSVTYAGASVPGLPGVTVSTLNLGPSEPVVVNPSGNMVVGATVTGTGVGASNNRVVLSGSPGTLSVAARSGQVAPGVGSATFTTFSKPFTVNSAGAIGFEGQLVQSGGVTASNDEGFWSTVSGSLAKFARESEFIDADEFYRFRAMSSEIRLNNAGNAALSALVTTSVQEQVAILVNASSGFLQAARKGQTMPGSVSLSADNTSGFDSFYPYVFTGANQVLFSAPLAVAGAVTELNKWTLWKWENSVHTLVLRSGTQAVGCPNGVVWGTNPDSSNFNRTSDHLISFHANQDGRVLMWAFVRGTDVTSANDTGIWAQDEDGVFHLLAREGSPFTVANGDVRTVLRLSTVGTRSGGEDGWPLSWNDLGQAVFRLDFTDNTSGIFVAQVYEAPVDPGPDVDNDGLPTVWEVANNLDPNDDGTIDINNGPLGDPDLDGFTNWDEYIAGTNPRDDTSFFAIASITQGIGGQHISIPTVLGRRYQAQMNPDLTQPLLWQDIGTSINGTGNMETLIIPDQPDGLNLRVRVELLP